MSEHQKNIVLRFALVFVLIFFGFGVVIGKIFLIQTTERDRWMTIAKGQVRTNQPIYATRGNILDRDERVLAASMPKYLVYMDGAVEPLHQGGDTLLYKHIDRLSQDLSRVLGDKPASEYKQLILAAHKSKKHSQRLSKKRINYIERKQLEQNPLIAKGKNTSGITFDEKKFRIKPYGELASRTLGAVNLDSGHGVTGLEKQYDDDLCGQDGISTLQLISGTYEKVPVVEAVDGCDIRTTIDANLQDLVETTLLKHTERLQAEWGCALLIESRTGRIRAMANLDRRSDGTYYEGENHCVQRVEPGSTFKTISLTAILEDGRYKIDDLVEISKEAWKYKGLSHSDAHPLDTVLTVRSALAVSSNIAFAKLVTSAYDGSADRFVKRLHQIVPTDTLLRDLRGAHQATIAVPTDSGTISKMSYGYSVELTPLQITTFYNAIANDGHMVRPYLVSDVLREGKSIRHYDTELLVNQICSPSVLRDVRDALHDVVWHDRFGTAARNKWNHRKAQSDLVHIAGKTGTAQLFLNRHYSNSAHRITFVGYFPEEEPLFTCLVMINHPKAPYDAGMDCGTAVREIAEQTMAQGTYYMEQKGVKTLHVR